MDHSTKSYCCSIILLWGLSQVIHCLVIQRAQFASARKLYGPLWNGFESKTRQCGSDFRISRENGHRNYGYTGHRSGRIIGGFPVEAPIPWQVSVEREERPGEWRHICGGSLISEHHILTASHCISARHRYRVSLGKYRLYSSSPYEQTYEIRQSNIVTHRRYGAVAEFANDIAILKIEQPNGSGAKLNEHVYPICIPDYKNWELQVMEPNVGECIVSGFGSVNGSMPDTLSSSLQATSVPIHSQERCSRLYNSERVYLDNSGIGAGSDPFLQNNRLRTMRFPDTPRGFGGGLLFVDEMLCAGSLTGANDHCFGDSGGPLACKHQGKYYLTGIVSWGRGCGESDMPGLYVRVSHFLRWIENEKLLLGPI